MDAGGQDELAAVMGRLAAGDETAVVTLYERFGDRVRGTVEAVLRQRGFLLAHDEVDGLVWDACQAVAGVAGAWRPDGGALPWTYARRRIENCVDRLLARFTVPLEDHLAALERAGADDPTPAAAGADGAGGPDGARGAPEGDRPLSRAFTDLVAIDERCHLLAEALDRAAVGPTDRELWFQYIVEQSAGNRSPATTVGTMFDLRDAAVRQRVHRSRRRVRRVATDDPRFAPLAGLPLFA